MVQKLWAFSLTGNGQTDGRTDSQSHSDCNAHLRVVQLSMTGAEVITDLIEAIQARS